MISWVLPTELPRRDERYRLEAIMRKRWWLALSVLLVAAIAVAFFFFRPAGVTCFGFARIRIGMTSELVKSVIGVPPGNYSSREDIGIVDHWASDWHVGEEKSGRQETWYSDDGCLRLIYDKDGTVAYKEWLGMVDHGPSFWKRVKGWVGL
jgi:hypothetical protein